ncbi:unnamed protein product [Camellia sinensis]
MVTLFVGFHLKLIRSLAAWSLALSLSAALGKGKNSDRNETSDEDTSQGLESIKLVVSQLNDLAISTHSTVVAPPSNSTQCSTPSDPVLDIDKKN